MKSPETEDPPRDETLPPDPWPPGGPADRRPARHGTVDPERSGQSDQVPPALGLPDRRGQPAVHRLLAGHHCVPARARTPLTGTTRPLHSTLTIGTTFPSSVNRATRNRARVW